MENGACWSCGSERALRAAGPEHSRCLSVNEEELMKGKLPFPLPLSTRTLTARSFGHCAFNLPHSLFLVRSLSELLLELLAPPGKPFQTRHTRCFVIQFEQLRRDGRCLVQE
mmetsp:Transcript_20656/g.41247  ORF Transcript_20656/g.41247 Transcript_20656/m.41247 type:complete len:112 (+) Transcript_20656:292-627(+)